MSLLILLLSTSNFALLSTFCYTRATRLLEGAASFTVGLAPSTDPEAEVTSLVTDSAMFSVSVSQFSVSDLSCAASSSSFSRLTAAVMVLREAWRASLALAPATSLSLVPYACSFSWATTFSSYCLPCLDTNLAALSGFKIWRWREKNIQEIWHQTYIYYVIAQ